MSIEKIIISDLMASNFDLALLGANVSIDELKTRGLYDFAFGVYCIGVCDGIEKCLKKEETMIVLSDVHTVMQGLLNSGLIIHSKEYGALCAMVTRVEALFEH